MQRRGLLAILAATPFPVLAQPARQACCEDDWEPRRPIRVIVPYAPGGSTDITARLIVEALGHRFRQPILVENRPGAGGNIGAEAVARATADGHTLLFATSSYATNLSLYRNLSFDPRRDFAPITQVSFVPNLFVVPSDAPARNLADLVALAKARPGALNYGSGGPGTSQHLAVALFASRTGIEVQHAPYRGGALAVADLLGNKIQFMATPLVEVIEHVRAGRLRALAVTTARRSALLPEVPTVAETVPDYEVALWNGFFAPAGTPAEAVHRIAREVQAALRTPETRERLAQQGCDPVGSDPGQFTSFIASEIPKWAEIVRISGAIAE